MQAISGLGNFTVSIQLSHRGTMTMFQPPALYQPPAVTNKLKIRIINCLK
jgi:hypothetical protein